MQNYPNPPCTHLENWLSAEICSHKSSIKINQWLLPGNQTAMHTCVIHIALNQHLVPSETNLQLRPSRHDVSPSSLSAFIYILAVSTGYIFWPLGLRFATSTYQALIPSYCIPLYTSSLTGAPQRHTIPKESWAKLWTNYCSGWGIESTVEIWYAILYGCFQKYGGNPPNQQF